MFDSDEDVCAKQSGKQMEDEMRAGKFTQTMLQPSKYSRPPSQPFWLA